MNVKSDKFNCYIEGIRIPNFKFRIDTQRNAIRTLMIDIPLGTTIEPKMWANAFIQLTYVQNAKEKSVFDGLCSELNVVEDLAILNINAMSVWDTFNFNSTLDYMSPKKYGLQNLDEGIVIYIGNESETTLSTGELSLGNELGSRYFFMNTDSPDIFEIPDSDPESNKLEWVINRAPFAIKFAYSILEDMQYTNFILSKIYIDRFNLLNKSDTSTRAKSFKSALQTSMDYTLGFAISLDPSRSGIAYKTFTIKDKQGKDILASEIVNNQDFGNTGSRLDALALAIQNYEGKVGDRNMNNNNPGNLEYGDFAKKHGATGTDGRFAIFPTYEIGFDATKALIRDVYGSYTLAGMMNKWAPSSDNNDTKAYIKTLASKLGVKPTDYIKDIIK